MIFDSGGILRDDGGTELARVEIAPDPAYATLSIGAERYEVLKVKPLGYHFRLCGADGEVVYDFRPSLRRGGTIHSAGGEELAALHKHLVGFGWTIEPARGAPIEVHRQTGLAGSVLVEGHTAPPALDLAVPSGAPVGTEEVRMLAFACWLIEQWEVEVI
ncbi:MAG TPA: hypothetical protein VN618_11750 [Solirubrobacteraceae bacterium]|nr:hypothetical protein [Solirubrobacteraceae bacterium]